VTTSGVNSSTSATLTATLGSTSRTTGITVTPATVEMVSVSASSVTGGSFVQVTVKLTGPAGPSGAVVGLSSSNSHLLLPPSVTITAGQSSYVYSAATTAVTTSTPVTITATYNGSYASTSLTLKS
jgi:hypothetical protein